MTFYKGKELGSTLGVGCRDVVTIFEALDILEKNYPGLFEHVGSVDEDESTLILYLASAPNPSIYLETIRVRNPYDGSYVDWKIKLRGLGVLG
jgi:hypothetical protein